MKRFLAFVATIITIAAPISASAENPPVSQKTSVEANCVWGSNVGAAINATTYNTVYAAASDWRFANPPNGECNMGIAYMPSMRGIGATSLTAYSDNAWSPERKSVSCNSGADPACDASKWSIMWNQSTFYKCVNSTDLNCIQEFSIKDSSGNKVIPTYLKSFPDENVRPAFNGAIVKYPAGGNPSIWSFTTPEGETKVLINGWYDMAWESREGRWEVRPGNMFQLFIMPIKETPLPSDIRNSNCYGYDKTTCLVLQPSLPIGYTYKVALNLSDNATMFLNGRLDKPIIFSEPIAGGHRFTIEAGSSPALSVAQWIPKSTIPKSVIDAVASKTTGTWFLDNLKWSNSEFNMSGGVEGGVELFNAMLPYFGDKASFIHHVWGVTNNPSSDRYDQKCRDQARGQILGVVSTNATAYRGDPPTYNKSTAELEYEVSAPHFMPDGKTDSIGRYSINMNANFLQCILGVSTVPAKATIGLTYGTGEVNVTTMAVKQDKDWLRVQLDNFHFSSPKISIKFSNSELETPIKSNETKTSKKSSSKSITCIKGKTIKKISSTNPKCPSGYKIKR